MTTASRGGRTAVVTGGGSGIGAALTRALVATGATVRCTDIDLVAAEKMVLDCSGPGTATPQQLDVTGRRSGRPPDHPDEP